MDLVKTLEDLCAREAFNNIDVKWYGKQSSKFQKRVVEEAVEGVLSEITDINQSFSSRILDAVGCWVDHKAIYRRVRKYLNECL